ncbi:hypothetical protein [Sinomonas terrae]|uniref:Uncharacterized protein n=1 Tax=Sinomonas terrae TaxID=2908838 RepID=A0ABS9U6B2_9MICC|nr:hypothetical protein [Sinomonas terrae]MCH6472228.1 hypothetical protein [Sinomonas terrae]
MNSEGSALIGLDQRQWDALPTMTRHVLGNVHQAYVSRLIGHHPPAPSSTGFAWRLIVHPGDEDRMRGIVQDVVAGSDSAAAAYLYG